VWLWKLSKTCKRGSTENVWLWIYTVKPAKRFNGKCVVRYTRRVTPVKRGRAPWGKRFLTGKCVVKYAEQKLAKIETPWRPKPK
jgi:hypothetical protein